MHSSKYDCVVIGGGYGGISTGTYLQRSGYKTLILERTALLGGVATPWRRREYLYDGATNWLAGSSPTSPLHYMLSEVIDFSKLTFIDPQDFMVIEHGGETFTVYADVEKLREEMLRIAPEDAETIDVFVEAIRRNSELSIPYDKNPDIEPVHRKIGILLNNAGFFLNFFRWKGVSIEKFARRFKSDLMRELFLKMFPHHPFFSMFAVFSTLGWKFLKSTGYPVGGGEALIANMADLYRSYGGEVRLSSEVKSINTEGDRVTSVVLESGEIVEADRVISALDGQHTFDDLLGGRYSHPQIERAIKNGRQTYPGLFQVSLGVKSIFPDLHHKYNLDLLEPLRVGSDEVRTDMMVRVCTEKAKLAPPGATVFIVHLRIHDVEYWSNLRSSNRELYREEKQRLADACVETLRRRFGDFEVDHIDTASPATYMRYSKVYRGSYQGWAPTPSVIGKGFRTKIDELKNFYISGQWVFPAGGITGVARVGRHLAMEICKEDSRPFLSQ